MRRSQNLPLLPEYTPLFNKCTCATLPKSTPPSQTIPSFSTTICNPPRIYPSLPEYTSILNSYMRPSQNLPLPTRIYPLFHNYSIMRSSQNLSLPLRIYSPFQPIYMCDPSRIYPCLPESTPPPPVFKNYKILPPSQNLPLTPRIFFSSGSEW